MDRANLGVIFRAITKRDPLQLRSLFKLSLSSSRSSPRRPSLRYQVIDATRALNRDYLDRSTFGYVAVFKLLPERAFHLNGDEVFPISVSSFHSKLIVLLRAASNELEGWEGLFFAPVSFLIICCAVLIFLTTLIHADTPVFCNILV